MKWYIVDIISPWSERAGMWFIADEHTPGIFTTNMGKARVFKLKREAVAWIKENLMGDREMSYFYHVVKEPDVILHKMGVK